MKNDLIISTIYINIRMRCIVKSEENEITMLIWNRKGLKQE